jgi:hypothetical protein
VTGTKFFVGAVTPPDAPEKTRASTPGCRRTGTASPSRSLVARRGHFFGRRQIDPELEAVNGDAFGGDFVMDQSAAGSHPLHVAWPNRALMTLIIVDRCGPRRRRSRSRSLGVGACRKHRKGTTPPSAPRTGPWLRNPAHRRRHQRPDTMPRRHSLFNLRSVDREDGSLYSSCAMPSS